MMMMVIVVQGIFRCECVAGVRIGEEVQTAKVSVGAGEGTFGFVNTFDTHAGMSRIFLLLLFFNYRLTYTGCPVFIPTTLNVKN